MSGNSKTVAFFGASTGIALPTLKHTLAAGHQCVALCRTPSKLTAIFPSKTYPNLKIVQGNAHDVASVSKCIQTGTGNSLTPSFPPSVANPSGLRHHPNG